MCLKVGVDGQFMCKCTFLANVFHSRCHVSWEVSTVAIKEALFSGRSFNYYAAAETHPESVLGGTFLSLCQQVNIHVNMWFCGLTMATENSVNSQSAITSQKCGLWWRPQGLGVPFGKGPFSPLKSASLHSSASTFACNAHLKTQSTTQNTPCIFLCL